VPLPVLRYSLFGWVQPKVQYRQAPLLFRNRGARRFEDVTAGSGTQLGRPVVARGAAHADYDRDGDLDIVITTNHGPAYLYRNDGGNRQNWITIRTRGIASNRDGIGAVVSVEGATGRQWQMVRSGSSYASQSDLALTFGLGGEQVVSAVEVVWPSGAKDRLANVPARQAITIEEGRGLASGTKGR
jgi:enediyne biosynthesis protein E4